MRVFVVTANGLLNAGAEIEDVVTETERGIYSEIKGIIPGVAVDDGIGARQGDGTGRVAGLEESASVGHALNVQVVCLGPLVLKRGARGGKVPAPAKASWASRA